MRGRRGPFRPGLPALVAALAVACAVPAGSGQAPLLETPDWRQPGTLLMRAAEEDGPGLLLKLSGMETVYRFDSPAGTLGAAGASAWESGTGAIVDCDLQAGKARSPRIEVRDGRLTVGGRQVPTAGSVALRAAPSPSGRLVAILSADGAERPSVAPSLGEGGARGPHYHQIVSLPDGEASGEAVRLPEGLADGPLTICWSADERAVVYADGLFFHMTIIESGAPLP